jgi:hypothetical protein
MSQLRIETMSLNPTPAEKERQHAEKVAGQFEDIFVRTMVSSLRQSSSIGGEGGGMFGSGPGADTYARLVRPEPRPSRSAKHVGHRHRTRCCRFRTHGRTEGQGHRRVKHSALSSRSTARPRSIAPRSTPPRTDRRHRCRSLTKDDSSSSRSARTANLLRQLLQGSEGPPRGVDLGPAQHARSHRPNSSSWPRKLAGEERARVELLAQIASMLPLPPAFRPVDLHLNVTRIAGALPTLPRAFPASHADEATSLAKSVRAEVALGQRLLRFATGPRQLARGRRRARPTPRPPGYDRNARRTHGRHRRRTAALDRRQGCDRRGEDHELRLRTRFRDARADRCTPRHADGGQQRRQRQHPRLLAPARRPRRGAAVRHQRPADRHRRRRRGISRLVDDGLERRLQLQLGLVGAAELDQRAYREIESILGEPDGGLSDSPQGPVRRGRPAAHRPRRPRPARRRRAGRQPR